MPETIALSESAVALLRFRIKGHSLPVSERTLPDYRELAAAGIMEPGDFAESEYHFTAWGLEHREEILEREWERIERERYEPPDTTTLSESALTLLRQCAAGRNPEGDEKNRPAYRELVKARIMIPLGSFSKGDECSFRFTYWGWHRRHELTQIPIATDSM